MDPKSRFACLEDPVRAHLHYGVIQVLRDMRESKLETLLMRRIMRGIYSKWAGK